MKKPTKSIVRDQIVAANGRKDPKESPSSDCDDCAICRGMKQAEEEGRELSMEELQALFQKQNTQS